MIPTILRILVHILTFCIEGWAIFHLINLIYTYKTHTCTSKTITQMLFSTRGTSRPLKSRATSTLSLGIWVVHPILAHHGRALIVNPLLRLILTWFIRLSSLHIPINISKLGLLNSFGIHQESIDIYIMMEHCSTIL